MADMSGVKNAKEFIKLLGIARDQLAAQATLTALHAGALLVRNEARVRCPKFTGNLRRSIHVLIDRPDAKTIRCRIGTNVNYGKYVEYGTGIYAVGGDGRKTPWVYKSSTKMKTSYLMKNKFFRIGRRHTDVVYRWTRGSRPKPFLFPAMERKRSEAMATVKKVFKHQFVDAIAQKSKTMMRK